MGRSDLKTQLGVAYSEGLRRIIELIADDWLIEVEIESARRKNSKKSTFLLALTAAERDAYLAAGRNPEALPEDARREYPEWHKPAKPMPAGKAQG